LPRWYAEFVGSKTFFAPVQSTWRDRTDVLGFYNDFSYVFKETDFLKRLYQSSYTHNNFNLMVLDEMNLSRIEYYFADFLSILEYPPEDWRVPLMTALDPEKSPKNVKNGAVLIPTDTWFVGTANKDDSTFTITDKVYDRAVVLDFKDRNAPFETDVDPEPITMTPGQMMKMFQEAIRTEEFRLTQEELDKFVELAEFVYDTFEIRFGNRIMNQISAFVPAYVGLGGTKEEALDIMFARKVLHKLEGRFEDYIKDGLIRFQKKLDQVYGKGIFLETEELIKQMLKKLV
jgi:5-methylcytosine-specific restriction endonuclease McrBC GTP-binding regulatory subunit McrB